MGWGPVQGAGTQTPISQSSAGPVPRGVLGDRGLTQSPCALPQFPHPKQAGLGLGGPGDSPQEVAEGVEETGEHGQEHQLRENGVSVGVSMGVSVGLPPTPTSFSWQPPTT